MLTRQTARGYTFLGRTIPDTTAACLDRYLEKHLHPGSFLDAVLSNDLKESCARGGEDNLLCLYVIVAFLWNCAPASAWGSRERFEQWIGAQEAQ